MLDSARRICLFIGMVVGAGFATGRELALYFFDANVATLILTGVLMGACYALFLVVGRSGIYQYMKNTFVGRLMSSIMTIAVYLSFVVMTRGAEELMYDVTGIRYIGVITGMCTAIVAATGMRGVKRLSGLLVPLLIVAMLILTSDSRCEIEGTLGVLAPMRYVGMNMLMAGYLILEEGERVSTKDIAISSTIVALVFGTLLVVIMRGISDFSDTVMPIYDLACARGARWLGVLLIYIAILTTLVGDAILIYDRAYSLVRYRGISCLLVMVLSMLSLCISFGSAVNIIYGLEGYIGMVFMAYVLLTYCYYVYRERRQNARTPKR